MRNVHPADYVVERAGPLPDVEGRVGGTPGYVAYAEFRMRANGEGKEGFQRRGKIIADREDGAKDEVEETRT
jgi:hypothetical protein